MVTENNTIFEYARRIKYSVDIEHEMFESRASLTNQERTYIEIIMQNQSDSLVFLQSPGQGH